MDNQHHGIRRHLTHYTTNWLLAESQKLIEGQDVGGNFGEALPRSRRRRCLGKPDIGENVADERVLLVGVLQAPGEPPSKSVMPDSSKLETRDEIDPMRKGQTADRQWTLEIPIVAVVLLNAFFMLPLTTFPIIQDDRFYLFIVVVPWNLILYYFVVCGTQHQLRAFRNRARYSLLAEKSQKHQASATCVDGNPKSFLHSGDTMWLNYLIDRIWCTHETAWTATLVAYFNCMLESYRPDYLTLLDSVVVKSLRLNDGGSDGPRLTGVGLLSSQRLSDDRERLEIYADFVLGQPPLKKRDLSSGGSPSSTDTADVLNHSQQTGGCIELMARIGKGSLAVNVPILVHNLYLAGRLVFQMDLVRGFPFMESVGVRFINPPVIEFALKPLKGSNSQSNTVIDQMLDIQAIYTLVQNVLMDVLAKLVIHPHAVVLNIQPLVERVFFAPTPTGVLRFRLKEGHNFPNVDWMSKSDPYALIFLQGKQMGRSRIIWNSLDPYWDQTFYLILMNGPDDCLLKVEIRDSDPLREHVLGVFEGCVGHLLGSGSCNEGVVVDLVDVEKLHKDGTRSSISFDIAVYKTVEDGTWWREVVFPRPKSSPRISISTGILHCRLIGAKQLYAPRGINTVYLTVRQNNCVIYKTKSIRYQINPKWLESAMTLISDSRNDVLSFCVLNEQGLDSHFLYGEVRVPVADLFRVMNENGKMFYIHEWVLSNPSMETNGRGPSHNQTPGLKSTVQLAFEFFPIEFDHRPPAYAANSASSQLKTKQKQLPCSGVLQLDIMEAQNLRNIEAFGISDPYVKVVSEGRVCAQTRVIQDCLAPKWQERKMILIRGNPVHARLRLEIWDENTRRADKPMGKCHFMLKEMYGENTESAGEAAVERWLPILCDNSEITDGRLHVQAKFFPILEHVGRNSGPGILTITIVEFELFRHVAKPAFIELYGGDDDFLDSVFHVSNEKKQSRRRFRNLIFKNKSHKLLRGNLSASNEKRRLLYRSQTRTMGMSPRLQEEIELFVPNLSENTKTSIVCRQVLNETVTYQPLLGSDGSQSDTLGVKDELVNLNPIISQIDLNCMEKINSKINSVCILESVDSENIPVGQLLVYLHFQPINEEASLQMPM